MATRSSVDRQDEPSPPAEGGSAKSPKDYGLRREILSPMETLAQSVSTIAPTCDSGRDDSAGLCARRKWHLARLCAGDRRDSAGGVVRRPIRALFVVTRLAL